MRTLLTVAMIAGVAALAGAQGRPAEQLKKAIVQEETGQNPEKAIEAYRAIVAQNDADRAVAATALYRLGETCRKAGMRVEAQAAYQRVVREFCDQTALADPSRRQLMDTFGVSESRTTRESEALLKAQRDLCVAREELEQSRASQARTYCESSTRYERSPRAISVEEARLELAMTERRMADIKAKVEAGMLSPADPQMLQLQRDLLALQRKSDELRAAIKEWAQGSRLEAVCLLRIS